MVRWRQRPQEVPLASDPSSSFVPTIIGAMVFLSTLVLSASLAMEGVADRWQITGQQYGATIEMSRDNASEEAVATSIDVLAQLPGISRVHLVGDDEILETIEGVDRRQTRPGLVAVTGADRCRSRVAGIPER